MCPVCLATIGLYIAGAASTGGLAALAVKVSRSRNEEGKIALQSDERRNENVIEHDGVPENSFAR